jgi:hypothetical protein
MLQNLAEHQIARAHTHAHTQLKAEQSPIHLGQDVIKARSHTDIHKQTTKITYPIAGPKLFCASAVYSPFKPNTS